MLNIKLLFSVALALLVPISIQAQSNSGITYHGRILKPNGAPLSGSSVQFKLQIRSPGNENCLLYEEVQTKNLSASNGAFSITINDMSGVRGDDYYSPGLRYTLDRVFQNRLPFSSVHSCETGTSYNPDTGDGRRFTVLFKDETMSAFEEAPSSLINFVPLALDSKTVGGFGPSHLLRVDDSAVSANATPLTSTQFTNLIGLVNGTSTLYTKQSSSTGATLPVVSTMPSAASAGSIWYDSTDGKLKYSNGTATPVILESGGAALPNVGTPGTYAKVTTDAQGRVTAGATLAESDIPQLTAANKVSGSAITTGNISTTGSFTSTSSVNGSYFSGRAVHINEFTNANSHYVQLRTPSAADGFTSSYVLTLPLNDGGANELLTTDGSGNLSWTSGSGLGAWSVASGNVYRSTGNVGIGIAAPTHGLHVDANNGSGFAALIRAGAGSSGVRIGTISGSGAIQGVTSAIAATDLILNGQGGKVGVGTTSPTALLHVESTAPELLVRDIGAGGTYSGGVISVGLLNGTNTLGNHRIGAIKFQGTGNSVALNGASIEAVSNGGWGNNFATSDLRFSTSAGPLSERMRIDPSGKVGIATTAPALKLEVVGNNSAPASSGTTQNGSLRISSSSSTVLDMGVTGGAPSYTWLQATRDNDLSLTNNISLNPRGGNVGIGTTAPGRSLQVGASSGMAQIGGGNGNGLTLSTSNNGTTIVGSNLYINDATTFKTAETNTGGFGYSGMYQGWGGISFFTSNGNTTADATVTPSSRLKINPNGNVGVGVDNPTAKFEVAGTIKVSATSEACAVTADGGLIRYSGTSLQFCNGTSWQTLGVSGSGIGSLGGLTGNAQTFAAGSSGTAPAISSSGTVHTLNVPLASGTGVTSGTISKTEYDAFNAKLGTATSFSGDVSGAYNATSVDKIKGVAVTITTPSAGQYLKYTAGGWVNAAIAMSEVTGLVTQLGNRLDVSLMSGGCTASQTLTYTAPTDVWACANISLPATQLTGTIDVARLPASVTGGLWAESGGHVSRATGNVGVGVAAPDTLLHISKSINNSSTALTIENPNTGASAVPNLKLKNDTIRSFEIGLRSSGATLGESAYLTNSGSGGIDLTASYSGVVNSAIRFNIASTEVMRVANSGNVGIGTASPGTARLAVESSAGNPISVRNTGATAASMIEFLDSAGTLKAGIGWNNGSTATSPNSFVLSTGSTQPMVFKTNSTEAMRILSDGNVGIGTTATTYKLDVNGTINATALYVGGAPFSAATSSISVANSGGQVSTITQTNTGTATAARSALVLQNNGAASAFDYNLLSKNASGAVTSFITPAGAANFAASVTTAGSLNGATLYTPYIFGGTTAGQALTLESTTHGTKGAIVLQPNGGNVGIGTGTDTPEEPIHVNTVVPDSGILIRGSFAGNDSVNLNFQRSRGTIAAPTSLQAGDEIFNILAQAYGSAGYNWTSGIMSFVDGTPSGGNVPASLEFWTNTGSDWGQRMKLAASGNLGIANDNPTYRLDVGGTARVYGLTDASDARLKNTIIPLRDDFAKIQNLQGVSYFWNDPVNHDADKQIGLIAQDVEKEYPELVETDKEGMKSVNYSHLVAPLIEAFKTFVGKFETLSVRVDGQSREIASVVEENKKLKEENAAIKAYLCAKDPEAGICR